MGRGVPSRPRLRGGLLLTLAASNTIACDADVNSVVTYTIQGMTLVAGTEAYSVLAQGTAPNAARSATDAIVLAALATRVLDARRGATDRLTAAETIKAIRKTAYPANRLTGVSLAMFVVAAVETMAYAVSLSDAASVESVARADAEPYEVLAA